MCAGDHPAEKSKEARMAVSPEPGWLKVVFAADCDDDGNCPVCAIDYADYCCPGPTMDDEYDYEERGDVLWAKRKKPN